MAVLGGSIGGRRGGIMRGRRGIVRGGAVLWAEWHTGRPIPHIINHCQCQTTQQTRGIHPKLFQCWATVFDIVGLMLGQRRRRWPNIKPTLVLRSVAVYGEITTNCCVDASPTYATLAQHSHDPVPTFLLRYLLLSVDTVRIYHLICHT